jgi:chromosome segregation protein
MISRLIEAKPDELRNTLEEAAGISRYKERRRETETRMASTRENLARLQDVRDEVDKQLEKLEKQAKAAQRFRELREQARHLEANLLFQQWQTLQSESAAQYNQWQQHSEAYQAQSGQLQQLETQIEQTRARLDQHQTELNQVQATYYQADSEIKQLEQSLQHQRDLQTRQQATLQQVQQAITDAVAHQAEDQDQLDACTQRIAELQPQLAPLQAQVSLAETQVNAAELALHNWQQQWQILQQQVAEPTRQAQVEKARMEQLERQLQQINQRAAKLQQEAQSLQTACFGADLDTLSAQLQVVQNAQQTRQQQLQALHTQWQQLQQTHTDSQAELAQALAQRQALYGRLAALETLQQSALQPVDSAQQVWLAAQALDQQPRLAQQLQVVAGWELAVETVLAQDLAALCVAHLPNIANLAPSSLSLLALNSEPLLLNPQSLATKVIAPTAAQTWLQAVYAVEDLTQAFALQPQLAAHESCITRDGLWLGRNWLRMQRPQSAQSGVLQRQQAIQDLQAELAHLETQISELESHQTQLQQALQAQALARQHAQTEVNQAHKVEADLNSHVQALTQQVQQQQQRLGLLNAELEELALQQEDLQTEHLQATEQRNAALLVLEQAQHALAQVAPRQAQLQTALQEQRQRLRDEQQQWQGLQLALDTQRNQAMQWQTQLMRGHERLRLLQAQSDDLHMQVQAADEPLCVLQDDLEQALARKLAIEVQLLDLRQQVQQQTLELSAQAQQRQQVIEQVDVLRALQAASHLQWQSSQVREQHLAEQLAKTEFDKAQLQAEASDLPDIAGLQQQLAQVQRSIQRLGAINLAALAEFQEQSERKQYLEQQYTDLVSALDMLTAAMQKIDRETRSRFKQTFEQVNARLGDMFTRLFGGGECYLELTSPDLLETGVAIMAKPPGKRLSSIYLMSGGEKALTAISLIFAIFALNPAPFCLLDEVDAPLDEANVGRFCELLRYMASQVQFIFITHNKTTMELAENLIGVTMREPGVSRLVAVDVAQAVRLANG